MSAIKYPFIRLPATKPMPALYYLAVARLTWYLLMIHIPRMKPGRLFRTKLHIVYCREFWVLLRDPHTPTVLGDWVCLPRELSREVSSLAGANSVSRFRDRHMGTLGVATARLRPGADRHRSPHLGYRPTNLMIWLASKIVVKSTGVCVVLVGVALRKIHPRLSNKWELDSWAEGGTVP